MSSVVVLMVHPQKGRMHVPASKLQEFLADGFKEISRETKDWDEGLAKKGGKSPGKSQDSKGSDEPPAQPPADDAQDEQDQTKPDGSDEPPAQPPVKADPKEKGAPKK